MPEVLPEITRILNLLTNWKGANTEAGRFGKPISNFQPLNIGTGALNDTIDFAQLAGKKIVFLLAIDINQNINLLSNVAGYQLTAINEVDNILITAAGNPDFNLSTLFGITYCTASLVGMGSVVTIDPGEIVGCIAVTIEYDPQ